MQYVLWDSAGTYCILFLLFFSFAGGVYKFRIPCYADMEGWIKTGNGEKQWQIMKTAWIRKQRL